MQLQPVRQGIRGRLIIFGLAPCLLGIGLVQVLNWRGTVWLSEAGGFWPIGLALMSAAIGVRLCFGAFEDTTSAIAAWLVLVAAWIYAPAWAMGVRIPHSSAIVGRDGGVTIASVGAGRAEPAFRLLTNRKAVRLVRNVEGEMTLSELKLAYRFADDYIATRRDGEDPSASLLRAAAPLLEARARGTRGGRIALLEDRAVMDGVIAQICRDAVGGRLPCPATLKLSPPGDATKDGATWSKFYTEDEAIAERHLPTLSQLLTRLDTHVARKDRIFLLILELAETADPLAQVARRSAQLTDEQFDELIRRILAMPGCSPDVIALAGTGVRPSSEQRQALRQKVLDEASIAGILDQAAQLRLSDVEVATLTKRMRPALLAAPGLSVRVLAVFGDRLPLETQRDVEEVLLAARASYALAALVHVNFAPQMRRNLLRKVVSDARVEDFAEARLDGENLQVVLTPSELREIAAMSAKRSETSDTWLDFTLAHIPIRFQSPAERKSLLGGLMFRSPKVALEFVSKNRPYLGATEVNEVTRDYTRTITPDFCLHLSHRNKNWRTNYFSEEQLQIFRNCADLKIPSN